MRKVLIGLIIFLSVFIGLMFGFQEKYNDLLQAETAGLKESWICIQIPPCSPQQLIQEIEALHSKYDCYFVREDITEEDGKTITIRSFSDRNVLSMLHLEEGETPQTTEQYVATYETSDPQQSGIMADLFEDDPRRFQSLSRYWKDHPEHGGGLYFLCCPEENQNEVLKELAAALNTSPEQLRNTNSFKRYDEGPVKVILAGAFVLGLLFILMCLFYPVSQIKKIGVYRLLGFSGVKIWFQLLWPVFAAGTILLILNIAVQVIFIPGITLSYIARAVLIQVGLLTGCVILSTLSLLVIRQYTLLSILKGNHHGTLIYWTSMLLKLAVFLLFIALVTSLILLGRTIWFQMQAASAFERSSNEMTVEQYDFIGDEFQQKLNGNDVFAQKMKRFFVQVEQTANARYIDPVVYDESYFRGIHESVPSGFEPIIVMNINENELAQYSAWFEQPVGSYFQKEGLTLLVPDTMTDAMRDLTIDAVRYPWAIQGKEVKIDMNIYKAKEKPFFTQNMLLINQGYVFVEDPVFVCLNSSVPEAWIGLDNQGLSNPIRIDSTKENKEAIKTALADAGLMNNNVKFASLYDAVFKAAMNGMKISTLLMTATVGFLFLVDLLASYYLTLIVLSIRKKEIFVKKILGYPFMARYQNEWINEMVIGTFGLCAMIFTRQEMSGYMFYLILLLTDGIMMSGLIRRQEKKALSLMLKGEE